MSEKQIEVLVVEPDHAAEIRRIDASLESYQSMVGGYIEAIYPFDDPVALICNEEGKLRGLELNRALRDGEGKVEDIIQGTFFLCGIGEEKFESLPKELQGKYLRMFHDPELFTLIEGEIVVIPVHLEDDSTDTSL